MKMHRFRPQVAVQLLLWGAIECWQLARAKLALHRLGAEHDSARARLGGRLVRGTTHH